MSDKCFNNTETRSNKIAGTSAVKKSKSVSDNKHVIKVGTKNSIPIEAIPQKMLNQRQYLY